MDDSLVMVGGACRRVSCPDVKKVVTGRHHLRDFMARSRHKNSSRSERRCPARKITTDPMNRTEPQISIRTFGLECETTVQSVSSGMQTASSELVKSGDWNLTTDGTQKQSTM